MLDTSGSPDGFGDYTAPSKRGVLFFSTVPRDMRPQEVERHFGRFGTITRRKFTPFPRKERRPNGPLLPLQFMRGYIEFSKAEDAEYAAAAMNGTPVDCKRRRRCSGQLWTVKYEKGFTWDVLLEEREAAVRSRRQREVEARSQEREINEAFRAAVAKRIASRAKNRKGDGAAKVSTAGGGETLVNRDDNSKCKREPGNDDVDESRTKRKRSRVEATSSTSDATNASKDLKKKKVKKN
ncbi:hypothetical protein, conserved [Trypanosoma brucei gambiense DAL972]|uniref:RRM domain-containing protein n=2 Tax=Trypanosoma brucei TaxID=5691 RepID=C9ZNN2_TRYB9|nr:hypothetical protein, conserved [Trypanosoma brucei gambiense DAL972]RHW72518.1 RNA-binding protein [Trypanosoma brucei equiperdum]CBH11010.1 hypothetical protein, conserved [Trypanosoma brucei gambiense DAL972]|eukprot:XP_011773297.1 hypothetical protein, conserved [Trypanosoma brucei gambiense DAL972]